MTTFVLKFNFALHPTMNIIVKKFGGTSLGTSERIQKLSNIIDEDASIVVVSAMAGTTNNLVEISKLCENNQTEKALHAYNDMKAGYTEIIGSMQWKKEIEIKISQEIEVLFSKYVNEILDFKKEYSANKLLCLGEQLSSYLLYYSFLNQGKTAVLVSAFDFMQLDSNGKPEYEFIEKYLNTIINRNSKAIIITQGFICRDAHKNETNLGRGGSDYSAAIIGNAINATEVQIWTDIDGFHNNDPRYVENTYPIRYLSFDEAAELAYFGAKILHPATIFPCRIKNIPVRLKNTLNPLQIGTLITSKYQSAGIKAVAAKDGITAINIRSSNMLMAYGFLKRVFSVFDSYKTSVDTITTSEVAVSVTIDNTTNLESILAELSEFSTVETESNQSIVCIVGDFMTDKPGISQKVFEALNKIPIRMISFGGSKNNISILIPSAYKKDCLNALQSILTISINRHESMVDHKAIEFFKKTETPFYYYDLQLLTDSLTELKTAANKRNYSVYYAIKANANERVLQHIASFGFGADCVSGNEILAAVKAGFKPSKIVFAGVGKTVNEIELAIKLEIFAFHCESLQELELIQEKAANAGKVIKLALRVNPGVDAKTHSYITTGTRQNKFGLSSVDLQKATEMIPYMPNIQLIGLHLHIGSQISNLKVFSRLSEAINELQASTNGGKEFSYLNVGGGLGIDYQQPGLHPIPDFEAYFTSFEKTLLLNKNQSVHFELGRAVVAQCGSLISRVQYVKGDSEQRFVILDAGMNDLMRPALYQAQHKIVSLTGSGELENCDIVGPVCETSDTFARNELLPNPKRGDIFALLSTGAYGEVMSSNYNLRERGKAIYSDEI